MNSMVSGVFDFEKRRITADQPKNHRRTAENMRTICASVMKKFSDHAITKFLTMTPDAHDGHRDESTSIHGLWVFIPHGAPESCSQLTTYC